MHIKNTGTRRIRLDRNLYLEPNRIIEVVNDIGKWAVKKHAAIINVTPKKLRKPKPMPKIKNMINLNLEVKENDIK